MPKLPRNEANVQAEFYHQAKLIGLNCILEWTTPKGRLDIAILNSQETKVFAIIECKRSERPRWKSSRQFARYSKLGVPVLALQKTEDATALARQMLSLTTGVASHSVSVDSILESEKERRIARRPKNRRTAYLWMDSDLNIKHVAEKD